MTLLDHFGWKATIGDPSIMGWITVFAYFFTAAVAFKLYLSSQHIFTTDTRTTQKQFWLIITTIMLFLGINKQLDLQSLLTAIGRYYAHRDGWYDHRRIVQLSTIIGIAILMVISMLTFMFYFRVILRTNWLAMVGLSFLLMFVLMRATSFHHIDILINTYILGMRMNWVLELAGILATALSGGRLLWR